MKSGSKCYYVNGRGEIEVGRAGGWVKSPEDTAPLFQVTLENGCLVVFSQPALEQHVFTTKDAARKKALEVIETYLCECLSKAERASVYKQRLLRKEAP